MPKMKSHSGAKKRFKTTGTGKLMRRQANLGHLNEHKSSKRIRSLQGNVEVAAPETLSWSETLTTNERVLGADPFVELVPAKGKEGEDGYEPEVAGGIGEDHWKAPGEAGGPPTRGRRPSGKLNSSVGDRSTPLISPAPPPAPRG